MVIVLTFEDNRCSDTKSKNIAILNSRVVGLLLRDKLLEAVFISLVDGKSKHNRYKE